MINIDPILKCGGGHSKKSEALDFKLTANPWQARYVLHIDFAKSLLQISMQISPTAII